VSGESIIGVAMLFDSRREATHEAQSPSAAGQHGNPVGTPADGTISDMRALPRRRGAPLLTWSARLLMIGGAAALAWCASVVTEAYIVQRLARERLESLPAVQTPSLMRSAVARSAPIPGTPLAKLSIPRIGLSAIVLEGSDDHTLRLGPGHLETTPLPGAFGNVVIAGHRDSFFRPLQNVLVGDEILLDTGEERIQYRVSSFLVVSPYEVNVIGPTADARLTLVTCYPFRFIGPAPDRFVVRAMRVGDQEPSHRQQGASQASR
jgi:sortase A